VKNRPGIKLSRMALPHVPFVGALNKNTSTVDADRDNCEMVYDPRTGVTSIFKGDRVSILLPSGAVGDVAEQQEEADAGPANGAAVPAPRRGRPPKNPPPVQT